MKITELTIACPKCGKLGIVIEFYETMPVGLVTGWCALVDSCYHIETPRRMWEMCGNESGLTEKEFFDYFKGCDTAYAYNVRGSNKYPKPLPLSHFKLKRAPQSWCYTK